MRRVGALAVPPPTVAFGPGNASAGAATSLTVALPAHQTGDLLVAQLDATANPTVTRPALWAVLREQASASAMKQGLYFKVATSGAEADPSFGVGATARTLTGIGMRFRDWNTGEAPSNPIYSNSGSGNSAGPHTTPGVTVNLAESVLVATTGKLTGTNENLAPAANYTEGLEVDNGTALSSEVATRSGPPTGATGTVGSTGTVAARWVAQLFVVEPAVFPALPGRHPRQYVRF